MPQTISFAQSPLFLGTTVKPNVLVLYDNSQSMDGTMAGKLIAGSDASTRGNIARSVLRSTITSYRDSFRWGLASFGLKNKGLYTTYAYYFGSDAEVVYTNNCVDGVSPDNGNRRCVANPQPDKNGFNFITYALTGDDPAINDVLYSGDFGPQLYGIGVNGTTKYDIYKTRGAGTDWNAGNFATGQGTWTFTPTDAGYLPTTPPNRREFFIKRAWGYYGDITGTGVVNRAVADDSAAHYDALMAFLAVETNNNATTELKNAAVFTPLAGTVGTARDYFANAFSGSGKPSPITSSCQRNFVLLATDGNPTGKTDGTMYTLAQQANTYTAATNTWAWSAAATDVFDRITGLRSVAFGAKNYDVQTYVIGMGDSVANQSSVAVLDRMASLGGTTSAYLASNEDALKAAFQKIAVDITSKTAAASAVSLNSGSWNTGSRVFQGRFSSTDWSGQLLSFKIGESGEPDAVPEWDAGQVLNDQHWSTDRQVLTYKPSAALGSRGVAFRWPAKPAEPTATEIDTGMSTALNKDSLGNVDTYGASRLEYLRGNTAREVANCGACAAPTFRNRKTTVLGDIISSAPVYVGGPTGDYRDTIESGAYSTYAVSRTSKTPMIFVGANDGMMHAFKASNGSEVFAYVPWAVRNKLSALTAPTYSHQYTVDGSPAVGDVYYGGAWRTLLVTGMSAGAKGVFALDVSDSANFTEAKADKVVRWEIDGSDGDMGHIFSRPVLAKTRDGKWRAIFGNGYNSTNGRAVLMLVDLQTGTVARVDTNAGAPGSPNGLSGIAAVSSADNGVVDIVYAGDLYGNVWRFDLSSAAPGSWKVHHTAADVSAPLFKAVAGQQITARPDVARHPKGGYLVSVGTGRYIDIVDNTTTGTQTIYGLWDKGATVAMADLQTQLIDSTAVGASGKSFRLTTHAVGKPPDGVIVGDNVISVDDYYATRKGWKMDLPTSGERVVSEATVRFGRLIVSTLIPSTAECSYGGDGWIMDVEVITGNRSPALDTNGDNEVTVDDYLNGRNAAGVKIGAIPAAASIMRSKKRNLDDKLINTSDGSIVRVREKGNEQTSRRAAWEQIR
ncbi:pilus assembly protein [Ideonella sp. A 288]|uniref:pilus assembly protein n=1 Tax=Ideonella sp. A 288 TaxID=1962181 RepID=UPI001303B9FE|nr:PilC/PilY family type IV pilus protein [Ideonella sp. A 288]